MHLTSIWKPQYVFRPWQIGLRIWRALLPLSNSVQEVSLPWGVSIQVNTKEAIGRTIWCAGIYDLCLCEALWRIAIEGGTAIDVGANIGQMTGLLACKVGASGKVVSFEPHPSIFQRLIYNIGLIARRRTAGLVTAHQIALSDADGEAYLESGEDFARNEMTAHIVGDIPRHQGDILRVTKRKLDSFIQTDVISVLKIDVEGHELAVLKGAVGALRNGGIRNIVYENHKEAGTGVPAFLKECGFSIFGLGYTMRGPILTPMEQALHINHSCDAPNYIATIEPQRVKWLFGKSGWSILKSRRDFENS